MPLTTRARPCDSCRARKTRCVKPPDRHECVLCAFHGKQCTYLRGPLARPRPTSAAAAASSATATASTTATAPGPHMQNPAMAPMPMNNMNNMPMNMANMPNMQMPMNNLNFNSTLSNFSALDLDLPEPTYSANSPDNGIVTSPDALMLTRERSLFNFNSTTNTTTNTHTNTGAPPSTSSTSTDASAEAFRDMVNLMAGTVGLDLNTHPEFIGPSSYHEPELLGLCRLDGNAGASNVSNEPSAADKSTSEPSRSFVRLARRVDARSTFLMYPDEATTSEPQRLADCDAIEDAVRPAGKALVDLYFRIVHPCFPIIHKGVFLSKYAFSHRMFSPPLLAAVYLLALDYHLYAASLPGAPNSTDALNVSAERQAALEVLAERTMTDDLKRPKISTLQAGLMLLQRRKFGMGPTSALFTAQLVAVAQNIGLHVDCEDWVIPAWEKGLRRRLGAILYVQDRWGALVHGRPPLLHDDNWNLPPCTLADFPEVDEDSSGKTKSGMAEGSINTDLGYEAFVQQTQLAHILSEIMAQFYSSAACRRGGTLDRMMAAPETAMAAAMPLLQKLRAWHAALPPTLALDCIQHRRLSANAPLHVARIAVEVALHRAMLRLMTSDTPAEIVNQVRSMAREHVVTSLQVLNALQPEHTGAFWSGVAAYQIVSIGSLIGLLWATTENADEVEWCTSRMDALRWALRLRGRAAPFMQEALRLLETVAAPMGFEQQL